MNIVIYIVNPAGHVKNWVQIMIVVATRRWPVMEIGRAVVSMNQITPKAIMVFQALWIVPNARRHTIVLTAMGAMIHTTRQMMIIGDQFPVIVRQIVGSLVV